MRHAVFAHGNFNFHAGIVNFAQHLLDTAHRLAKQRGGFGQLHHHYLTCLGRPGRTFGNQYVLTITLVFGRYQPDTAFLQQATDNGIGRSLDDFRDPTFRPVLAVVAHDTRLHAVFVQHSAHFIGRQINIGLAIVAQYKTVAIAVTRNGALELSEEASGRAGILRSSFDKNLFC